MVRRSIQRGRVRRSTLADEADEALNIPVAIVQNNFGENPVMAPIPPAPRLEIIDSEESEDDGWSLTQEHAQSDVVGRVSLLRLYFACKKNNLG